MTIEVVDTVARETALRAEEVSQADPTGGLPHLWKVAASLCLEFVYFAMEDCSMPKSAGLATVLAKIIAALMPTVAYTEAHACEGALVENGDTISIRLARSDLFVIKTPFTENLEAVQAGSGLKFRVTSRGRPDDHHRLEFDEPVQIEPTNVEDGGGAYHLSFYATSSPGRVFVYNGGPANFAFMPLQERVLMYGCPITIRGTSPNWYWSDRTITESAQWENPLYRRRTFEHQIFAGDVNDAARFVLVKVNP